MKQDDDSFIPTPDDMRKLITTSVVVDLETTQNSTSGFSATPHDTDNYIVAAAMGMNGFNEGFDQTQFTVPFNPWDYLNGSDKTWQAVVGYGDGSFHNDFYSIEDWIRGFDLLVEEKPQLIIGHNIAFDLQYIMNEKWVNWSNLNEKWVNWSNLYIWDTMLAQHYMSGQQYVMPSLEKACDLCGIPFTKDEEIALQFQLEMGSESINPVDLMEYLSLDIKSTNMLFMHQHNAVHKNAGVLGLRYLIGLMTARLTTARAEKHGLCVNTDTLTTQKKQLQLRYDDLEKELLQYLTVHFPSNTKNEITPTSPPQIKTYLFGGKVECVENRQVLDEDGKPVRYKSGAKKGQIKTKKESYLITYEPCDLVKLFDKLQPRHKLPERSTSSKDLGDWAELANNLILSDTERTGLTFIETVLEFRKVQKELTTSYEGLEKHLWPVNEKRAYVHPSFNHGITRTKRLSSSSPNLQNISNKEVDTDV